MRLATFVLSVVLAASAAGANTPETLPWQTGTAPNKDADFLNSAWAFDPHSKALLLGTPKGLFTTNDGGATWKRVDGGSYRATGIFPGASAGHLYAIARRGEAWLQRSVDAGKTWAPHGAKDRKKASGKKLLARKLWVDRADPNRLFLLTGTDMESHDDGEENLLQISVDGGRTFSLTGLPDTGLRDLALTPSRICAVAGQALGVDPGQAWENKVLCSADNGRTWTPVAMGGGKTGTIERILWISEGKLMIVAGGGLFSVDTRVPKAPLEKVGAVPWDDVKDFHPHPTDGFPVYLSASVKKEVGGGITMRDTLFVLERSGKTHAFAGPSDPFLLMGVDFGRRIAVTGEWQRATLPSY